MTYNDKITAQLDAIQQEMQKIALWQSLPPPADAFLSEQPFAIDTLAAQEWLQWIFIPRMRALIDAKAELPRHFSLHPYFSEALKEAENVADLLALIKQLDDFAAEKS
ncbi:YqcC family protein [Orbaceae bacterium ESL0727]|nr:YqcC family protein [Orbaceae bacterium ESL0727]